MTIDTTGKPHESTFTENRAAIDALVNYMYYSATSQVTGLSSNFTFTICCQHWEKSYI